MRSSAGVLLSWLLVVAGCGGARVDGLTASRTAIVDGALDGTAHPFVGQIVTLQSDGSWMNFCSGSLVSPTIYVTAGHCVFNRIIGPGLVHGQYGVTLDSVVTPVSPRIFGTAYLNPAVDMGVIVLDEGISLPRYAALPSAGLLDELQKSGGLVGQEFTIVGYGSTDGGPHVPGRYEAGVRRVSTVTFDALMRTLMLTREDPAGEGAICFGDSGGPYLFADTDLIASITSFGNPNCQASEFSVRMDTPAAREFLQQFVTLP